MIYFITGKAGSGKSLYAVREHLLPALISGRKVYTNIPIVEEEFEKSNIPKPIQITIDQIKDKSKDFFKEVFEAGSLLIIDECSKLWMSGMRSVDFDIRHLEFISEHRHQVDEKGHATEIIIMSQVPSQIAKLLTEQVHNHIICQSLRDVGLSKTGRYSIYKDTQTAKKKDTPIKSDTYKMSAKYGKFYKSATQSKTDAVGKEVSKHSHFFQGNAFKFGSYFVGLALIGLYFFKHYGILGNEELNPIERPVVVNNTNNVKTVNYDLTPAKTKLFNDYDFFISSRSGEFPNYDFKITLENNSKYTVLDQYQLSSMGFQITKFSNCLIRIKSPEYGEYFATCKRPENYYTDNSSSNNSGNALDTFSGEINPFN